MILVELIRLVIVLGLTAAGYKLGNLGRLQVSPDHPETSRLIASVIGAGFGYVVGGAIGRSLLSGIGAVEKQVEKISGGAMVVGVLGVIVGVLAATLVSWPILALITLNVISYPLVAIVFIVFGYAGYRVALRKRFDVLGMMGLTQDREFGPPAEQTIGGAKVLDSSAIIDGRIVDVAKAGFFVGHVILPRFILAEIQSIADSADEMKRARGRRGLEVLDVLKGDSRIRLQVSDDELPAFDDVDAKLVALAKRVSGVLVTTDYNLHKSAELQGVPVLNLNNLAASLKPVVLPGEKVTVTIIRAGSQKGQGVGYLDDGTMVVVESASEAVGQEMAATVTSVLQTAAGRMVFSVPDTQ